MPPPKVLIIDNEPAVIDSIENSLKHTSYKIYSTTNGGEGLELHREHQPILTLLNIKMPGMDVSDFLEQIDLNPNDPCTVILLTNQDEEPEYPLALDKGVIAFVRKPFNVYELRVLIENTIALKLTRVEHMRAEKERDRILTLSHDLICIAGMDGFLKYVNPAWRNVLGYTTEELLSRPFLDFIHPDDHAINDE
ncbi:MAG: response regulator, partial [Planctomycetes bacterium]|nr:response regulator [Planctomycetota bacterium]